MFYRFFVCTTMLIITCQNPATLFEKILFDFTSSTARNTWVVQDDTVMGGRSQGRLEITDAGHARFYGRVSLENNGGFSSILHRMRTAVDVSEMDAFVVRLKGDGKTYALRVKSQPGQRYYHQATFKTSGDWETIRVPFSTMSAVYRGRSVNVPNFAGGPVNTIQVLIGNKKAQDFELFIDRIAAD